jgi:two-component system, LytTR family, response regulator
MSRMSSPRFRVVVADDEPLSLDRAARLVIEASQVELIAACASAEELLDVLQTESVDIAVLDIQMPKLSGVELARHLREHPDTPEIIFVTAHSEHAVTAFDLDVSDYVLKPYSGTRFHEALIKACTRRAHAITVTAEQKSTSAAAETRPYLLAGESRDHHTMIAPAQLHWIEAKQKTCIGHTSDRCFGLRLSISQLAALLPMPPFVRVHRSAIVNLDHVVACEEFVGGSAELVLVCGTRVSVSRRLRHRLNQFVAGF